MDVPVFLEAATAATAATAIALPRAYDLWMSRRKDTEDARHASPRVALSGAYEAARLAELRSFVNLITIITTSSATGTLSAALEKIAEADPCPTS